MPSHRGGLQAGGSGGRRAERRSALRHARAVVDRGRLQVSLGHAGSPEVLQRDRRNALTLIAPYTLRAVADELIMTCATALFSRAM